MKKLLLLAIIAIFALALPLAAQQDNDDICTVANPAGCPPRLLAGPGNVPADYPGVFALGDAYLAMSHASAELGSGFITMSSKSLTSFGEGRIVLAPKGKSKIDALAMGLIPLGTAYFVLSQTSATTPANFGGFTTLGQGYLLLSPTSQVTAQDICTVANPAGCPPRDPDDQ